MTKPVSATTGPAQSYFITFITIAVMVTAFYNSLTTLTSFTRQRKVVKEKGFTCQYDISLQAVNTSLKFFDESTAKGEC